MKKNPKPEFLDRFEDLVAAEWWFWLIKAGFPGRFRGDSFPMQPGCYGYEMITRAQRHIRDRIEAYFRSAE